MGTNRKARRVPGNDGKRDTRYGKEKKAVGVAQENRESTKIRIGRDVVSRFLTHRCSESEEGTEDDAQEESGEDQGQGSSRKRHRKSGVRAGGALEAELKSFDTASRDADMYRFEVEKERLVVKHERVEMERTDCEKESELTREERVAQRQLEPEKFKMMMDAFMQTEK